MLHIKHTIFVKSKRRPVAPATERATPAAQQANATSPYSLDGGGGSPARPQTGRWAADRPTLPFGFPQRATAASCGNGERSRAGGDSRPPVRSSGGVPRRGAAAACPHRGADRESLTRCPLRIQCESQSPILPPSHPALLLRHGAATMVPQLSWSAAAASWRGRRGAAWWRSSLPPCRVREL